MQASYAKNYTVRIHLNNVSILPCERQNFYFCDNNCDSYKTHQNFV